MNRLIRLEKFCEKTGIFCFKSHKFGPYGHALLNQIKNEWLRFNLNKFSNNFLIEHIDLMKDNFDLATYLDKISNFGTQSKLVGLINTFNSTQTDENFFRGNKTQTNLNTIHLNFDSEDFFSVWQRERLQWWSKIAHYPEHLVIEKPYLIYQYDQTDIKNKIEKIVSLENFEKLTNFKNLNQIKNLCISETTCETVLENILVDSVKFSDDFKLKEKLGKYGINVGDKIYFNLDFRLAPYKVCLLYSPHVKAVAEDFKNIFYLKTKHNILLFELENGQTDLESKYDHIDLMGIPYSVYLPDGITKDGISRGKTNTLLGGPISELTNLASKLCNNENPAIVLETDSCNLLIKREGTITAAVYKQVS
ncbi:DNA polymerase subunit gamma- mitochondrial [Brachionus plicatilis]|uniref:DNA polymerase subunit gamma-mitochondrial n=1 Tax=Brachionus plicatilis TaxID=10195 RepID=A0A3M7PTN7_BRAPC|nr:DNA polymerase subunit gamma- mitochondrial [Brachionus plicatilis]